MKSLALRQDYATRDFNTHLTTFLRAFSGLENLSILLEGDGQYLSPACIIENHGNTLKTLVWEQRIETRCSIDSHTEIQSDADDVIKFLSRGCPNLREIGLVLNVQIDGHRQSYSV